MPGVRLRTAIVPDGGELFPGARVAEPRLLRSDEGVLSYVLSVPQVRRWGDHGDLADARTAEWSLAESRDGAVLTAEAGAEVDLLELTGDAAAAFESDSPEALTIVPSFQPIGGARELGEYLVGGRVLTGTAQIKKPIDSTSLSLYRTARLRGGPLWDGVAAHVAEATARRVEEAPSLPHDMWSAAETHVRFVNDALLLLAAHAEWTGEERFGRAAGVVSDRLDELSVDLHGGRWVLHDSIERDAARNDLVLNTHLQATVALIAAGHDVDDALAALNAVLQPRAAGWRGVRGAAHIGLREAMRAYAPRRLVRPRVKAAYEYASQVAKDEGALRFPGGWIARDLSGRRTPGRYLTVNLGDLAALLSSRRELPPALHASLHAGLGFARRSGFFRAEIRDARPMATLIPAVLALAGEQERAASASDACRQAGLSPMVGWPGYTDALWERLGMGAPL